MEDTETYSDEAKKTVIEDPGSETTALVQQDADAEKHKGCKCKRMLQLIENTI